jgi:hypothetical protein
MRSAGIGIVRCEVGTNRSRRRNAILRDPRSAFGAAAVSPVEQPDLGLDLDGTDFRQRRAES